MELNKDIDDEIFNINEEEIDDETVIILTEWGCLSCVLSDYNIDFSHITPKMGSHMVQDFLELLERCGYIKKINEEEL